MTSTRCSPQRGRPCCGSMFPCLYRSRSSAPYVRRPYRRTLHRHLRAPRSTWRPPKSSAPNPAAHNATGTQLQGWRYRPAREGVGPIEYEEIREVDQSDAEVDLGIIGAQIFVAADVIGITGWEQSRVCRPLLTTKHGTTTCSGDYGTGQRHRRLCRHTADPWTV